MPDPLLQIIVSAAIAGVGSLLVTWATEGVAAARRSRRLDQLKTALEASAALPDAHAGREILHSEIASLLSDIQRSVKSRPLWRSAGRYIIGLVILFGGTLPLYILFWPETLEQPLALAIPACAYAVIFAIESRPLFLRRLVELLKRPVNRASI